MIDAFLQLFDTAGNPVHGESKDQAYAKWIEIHEFSFGTGERGTAAGLGAAGDKVSDGVNDLDDRMKTLTAALKKLKDGRNDDPNAVRAAATDALTNADVIQNRIAVLRKAVETFGTKASEVAGTVATATVSAAASPNAAHGSGTGDRLKFSIEKQIDSASPDLFQAFCRQAATAMPATVQDRTLGVFDSAYVVVRKLYDGTPMPYLGIEFKRVLLDDYSLSYSSSFSNLVESVDFTFVDYTVEYYPQKPDGQRDVAVTVTDTVGGQAAIS